MQLLKQISFGARVAEDETNELESYFVETDQWGRIFGGEIDVIKGEKGAGKSAIYSLLSTKSDALFDKRILLITAEEPRGAPVFVGKDGCSSGFSQTTLWPRRHLARASPSED